MLVEDRSKSIDNRSEPSIKDYLLGREGVLREELGEDFHHVTAVEDALGAQIAARGRWGLKDEDVSERDVLDVHVRLDRVGVGLGRPSQVLEDVDDARVDRRLKQRSEH